MDNLKPLPQNIEAEQSLIGAILVEPSVLPDLSSIVQSSDFYDEHHKAIFEMLLKMRIEGKGIDFISVRSMLKGNDELITALVDCSNAVSSSVFAVPHAQIVKEDSMLRGLHKIGVRLSNDSSSGSDAFELIEKTQRELVQLSAVRNSRAVKDSGRLLSEFEQMLNDIASGRGSGIKSHIPELNRHIGGFRPGEVTLIAANTSIGKTNFVIAVLRRIAERHSSALFSLEMNSRLISNRIISQIAGIEPRNVLAGSYTKEDFQRLAEAKKQFSKLKLFVDDTSLTLNELEGKVSQLKATQRAEFIAVDYLNLIRTTAKHDSREREIAFISQTLKRVAKENDCAMIAVAALDKAGEMNGSPRLSNIRESSMLLYDADNILLLDRPGSERRRSIYGFTACWK
ncbi:MAG: replicative DNA helicase [Bacteroidetes bacterium]|nr:replicative DNA helicase [Bacteroidota bacterium]